MMRLGQILISDILRLKKQRVEVIKNWLSGENQPSRWKSQQDSGHGRPGMLRRGGCVFYVLSNKMTKLQLCFGKINIASRPAVGPIRCN